MSQAKQSLQDDLIALLQQGEGFNRLALSLFRNQYEKIPLYRSFCEQFGCRPTTVFKWEDIPALPTEAFKLSNHGLCTSPKIVAEFLTSGTTGETRGRHLLPTLQAYRASVMVGWEEIGPGHSLPLIFLAQSPEDAPHSSLATMMGFLGNETDSIPSPFLIDASGQMNTPALIAMAEAGRPFLIFGTALAFLGLIENNVPINLPAGSQIMETGGYKGSGREISKTDLYRQLGDFFGIPTADIWNEYSMTELSSQAYARGPNGRHHCPASMRIRVVDPETRIGLPFGRRGHLLIYDVANLYSCCAIETRDFAIAHSDSEFTLLGRDSTALPRGCSRASDELLRQL